MSKLAVTSFSKRTGSPFHRTSPEKDNTDAVIHEEVLQKSYNDKQKEKQTALIEKVNKKTAEINTNKAASGDGFFTEVVTAGAFTSKNNNVDSLNVNRNASKSPTNGTGSKSLMGFPSSANDLALDAKSDLESDPQISMEVKEKVIEKLFALVNMVQHIYESKVRVMTDFDKYKENHLKNDLRKEKEHAEQLYRLNMNYQSEVVQAIQQLKTELDMSRNATKNYQDKSDLNYNSELSNNLQASDDL